MQIDEFVQYLIRDRKVKPRTVNRKINAISTYFRYLKQQRLVEENPMDGYERMKVAQSERTYLSKDELKKS